MSVQELLGAGGPVARRLEGFEARPQQLEMARLVESTLDERGRLIVEAGTGVGKSFAYLVPAIMRVLEHKERVVVVTNTINLQEQLIEKDLPLLNAVIPDEFSAVLVKGRGNYVSLRRLKLASSRQDRLCADDDARHALHLLEDWTYDTEDGSLATAPHLPRPEVWDYAQSDANNCMGRKCPTYQQCFYQQARRRMEHGDLLVCNHALFFSDLALRVAGAGFLPRHDHVILDEAHGIEEIAADHFGASLSEPRVAHLLNLLYEPRRRRGVLASLRLHDGSTSLVDRTVEQTMRCWEAKDAMFRDLESWQAKQSRPGGRIDGPGVVENALTGPMNELSDLLRALREKVASEADEYELNSYAVRSADIARQARSLVEQRYEGCVYFVEGAEQRTGPGRRPRRRISLRCMAVDVAPVLSEHLFARNIGVVMTSATLATAAGDFSHVVGRLGCPDAKTVQLGSPFDHARQMKLVVCRSLPSPSASDYVERLVPCIVRLARETDGGAFVLFTSFAMLNAAARLLRAPLGDDGMPVLVQGADGRPGALLRRFRADRRSVLLGTTSFWQGVDVRGDGLRNVIITRLPFEVPDRPLVEARHERIREQGGHPFTEDQLPRAVIRFRQGVGRLIRSETDRGVVAVLDPRIVTKGYGRVFRAALPEDVVIEELEEVATTPDDPGDWFDAFDPA